MIQKNELMPNLKVIDRDGATVDLWDFRQRSHSVVIHEPAASPAMVQEWFEAVRKNQKQWDWLNVKFFRAAGSHPGIVETGVYVVDRYGRLIRHYPTGQWTLQDIEQDYVYYEAHYC